MQREYRYLPQDALRHLCEISDITPAAVTGVSTFYTRFRHRPVGQHLISVCHGTACHVKGAKLISEAFGRKLGLGDGRDTTEDGLFTLQRVDCLGCCTLAPAVQIDGVTYGHLTTDSVAQVIEDFLRRDRRAGQGRQAVSPGLQPGQLAEVRIGVGSCCIAGGSMEVREALEDAIREVCADAVVKPVGCVGMCHQTPLVEVHVPGEPPAIYARVQPADAAAIIRRHFEPKGLIRKARLAVSHAVDKLLTDEAWEPVTRYAIDTRDAPVCAFLGPQQHLATELYGVIDPLDLEDYIANGGFSALRKCLAGVPPEAVIAEVQHSGLRGRGGAGFPTGRKWGLVRKAESDTKYVVCNGDEGDPGAFMDRMLLESYPFRVLEGLAIAAYAVGAGEGILYIRNEYPLAVQRTQEAIHRLEERGLLGDDINGTGFGLHLRIMQGAGAFVCGEETALIASLEGRRGMPRLRPHFPAEKGLWGKPTCVNNVETLALIPWIVRNGAEAFAALGTQHSAGTKVFSLTGKIKRGGLIEVPMGVTIRQIVEEIGGGVANGRQFKAVQIGGPSGGCIPASLADTPVDYEALTGAGAIMGSGGLVVMDDTDCMVDVARYFLEATQNESCGKCTFCRIGTRKMLDLLEGICTGQGKQGDIEKLEELAVMVKRASLCGLGQTAPNPVLSTIRYFREEYEAHLKGRCPAGKCRAMIHYRITDACIGCTKCAQKCPVFAIPLVAHQKHEINDDLCIRCGTCRQVCPVDAVVVE
jgi:NADH-quinone oxidoreductase subunit F